MKKFLCLFIFTLAYVNCSNTLELHAAVLKTVNKLRGVMGQLGWGA